MDKDRESAEILAECLERLERGEELEDCLSRYPERAEELRSLLLTALRARDAFALLRPGQEFKERVRARLLSRPESRRPFTLKRLVPFLAPLMALIVLGGSTVVAASESLPDQPLYPVKLTVEHAQLWLTPGPGRKVELQLKFVEKRLKEMDSLARKGKLTRLDLPGERLKRHLKYIREVYRRLPPDQKARIRKLLLKRVPVHKLRLRRIRAYRAPRPIPAPRIKGTPERPLTAGERLSEWEREYLRTIGEILK